MMKKVIIKILRKIYLIIYDNNYKKQFFSSQKNSFNLSKKTIKKANKLGFTADEYAVFDLENNNYKDYISELDRMRYRDSVRNYRIILDNKIIFYNIIRNFADVNKIYAYKQNNCFTALEEGFNENSIIEKLKNLGEIVYKKQDAGGGEGFKLMEYKEDCFFINRHKCEKKDICQLINQTDNYLLEEFCVQGDFLNAIFPYSVNTIRIITAETEKGKYEVLSAIQRMGVDKEKCVDNACAGGLYSKIDMDTGVLSAARSHAVDKLKDFDGNVIEFKNHPETNHIIEGITIPRWDWLISQILLLHQTIRFTGVDFIAWDIALTDTGFRVIEANASCSVDLLQAFNGERNRKIGLWMKERGYIK